MEILKLVENLSPLGVIGLLVYIVYLLINHKKDVTAIRENHLHNLPDMAASLAASLTRMEQCLGEIRDGINYLRGRAEYDRRRGGY